MLHRNFLNSKLSLGLHKVLVLLLATLAIVPGLQTQLLALSLWSTDYGYPMKASLLKSGTFVLGQTNSWAFGGISSQTISTHFGAVSPLSNNSIIQPLFLRKLSLCIHITKTFIGFEFGPRKLEIYPSCVRSPCSGLCIKANRLKRICTF